MRAHVPEGFDDLHGDQGDAEVSDLHEQPVQLRLVRDDTAKAGCAVAFVGQGEVTEPGRPVFVEVPVDAKFVAGGHLSFGGLGHEDPTFAVALIVRRPLVRLLLCRRMMYSARVRLMAQPAPRLRSVVSSLVNAKRKR